MPILRQSSQPRALDVAELAEQAAEPVATPEARNTLRQSLDFGKA